MHRDTLKSENNIELDSLFAQARAEQPLLLDTNFTKAVVNQLPTGVSRVRKRSLSFDFFGMIFGLIAVSFFIEPAQLFGAILNFVPESLTLSASTLAMGLLASLGLSFSAWWAVEKIA